MDYLINVGLVFFGNVVVRMALVFLVLSYFVKPFGYGSMSEDDKHQTDEIIRKLRLACVGILVVLLLFSATTPSITYKNGTDGDRTSENAFIEMKNLSETPIKIKEVEPIMSEDNRQERQDRFDGLVDYKNRN